MAQRSRDGGIVRQVFALLQDLGEIVLRQQSLSQPVRLTAPFTQGSLRRSRASETNLNLMDEYYEQFNLPENAIRERC